MKNTITHAVFKEIHERAKRGEENEFIVVDTDTLFAIKKTHDYVPYFLQPEKKGDTFLSLKIAVRDGVQFGWEIR